MEFFVKILARLSIKKAFSRGRGINFIVTFSP